MDGGPERRRCAQSHTARKQKSTSWEHRCRCRNQSGQRPRLLTPQLPVGGRQNAKAPGSLVQTAHTCSQLFNQALMSLQVSLGAQISSH